MSDNKRELNGGEAGSPGFDNTTNTGESLSRAFTVPEVDHPSQDSASREAVGAPHVLHSEEIIVEHLDELPDVENVEELIGEGHVYDEETAGALVALMFAKAHQEDDTIEAPEHEPQETEEPRENPTPSPRVKKKRMQKQALKALQSLYCLQT